MASPSGTGGTARDEFRARAFDALADLTGCAVVDLPNGKLAVVDLDGSRVWLVTIEDGSFEAVPDA